MDLKAVFKETYDIHYQAPGEVRAKFVDDVNKVLARLNDECQDIGTFSLSDIAGNVGVVYLECRGTDLKQERLSSTVLRLDYDPEGMPVLIQGADVSELYDVDSPEGMNYLLESIIKKVARDFAVYDMKTAQLEAMKKGFSIE